MPVNFRPGYRPRDSGAPTLADLLQGAIDEGAAANDRRRQRALEEERLGMEREGHAMDMAVAQDDMRRRGIRRRGSGFEAPEPPDLTHRQDPFAGQQLGMAGEDRDVGMFEGAPMGMGSVSPQEPQILPGQFHRRTGTVVKDPVAFRAEQFLMEEAARGPDAIPLTEDFELDPSATPEAAQARAGEVERARADAERGALGDALRQAGVGAELADLLALRPDLIDNSELFQSEAAPELWQPTTREERLGWETDLEELRYPGGRLARRPPTEQGGLTMDQAIRRVQEMYAVRNELGDITGYSLSQPEIYDLAEQWKAGGEVRWPEQPAPQEAPPAAEEPEGPGLGTRLMRWIRGGDDEAGDEPPVASATAPGAPTQEQLAAVDSAMAVVREFGDGLNDQELREAMEEEGYEGPVIDLVLEARGGGR